MKKFFQSWLINTLAVLVAGYVIKGIHYDRPLDLLVASLVLGILNTILRPILMLLALPVLFLTLGLFYFVINGFILYFVGFLLRPHFYVDGFWDAFTGEQLWQWMMRDNDVSQWSVFSRLLSSEAPSLADRRNRKISLYYGIDGHADNEDYQALVRDVHHRRLSGLMFGTSP